MSMEFCKACRSTPTLHMRVDHRTPCHMWSPIKSQTRCNSYSSKVRILSRVPVVRALILTWDLSLEVLIRTAAMELWSWTDCLHLRGASASLGSMVWPRGLTRLVLDTALTMPVNAVVWPIHLQSLRFSNDFKKPIAGVVWPASLQQLSLGYVFNQPIVGAVWPASLQQLSLGNMSNQPIVGVVWPGSLR